MKEEPSCAYLGGCPMYAKFQHKGTLAVWKINYCEGEYQSCQRFQVRSQGDKPPDELLPNGALLKHAI